MKILIIGRAGQLAQALIARAQALSELDIVTVGRPALDLEVPGSAERAIRTAAPDVVVNAAGFTAVDRAEKERERAFRINADAAGEVARAAAKAGAPVIQISTDHVFDGASAAPYREDASTNPLNAYGLSKLAGEDQVRRANRDYVIVRTAWLYGPFGSNFVTRTLALAAAGTEPAVVSGQKGSPTSALDLADGLLVILRRWRSEPRVGAGETFHLAGGGTATRFELAAAAMAEAAAIGLPSAPIRAVSTRAHPSQAIRPMDSTLDCSKFAALFDYRMPLWRPSLRNVVRAIGAEQLSGDSLEA